MDTGDPIIAKEERTVHSDGDVRFMSTTKMPLRDKDGNIFGTFGISRDLSEHKVLEEQLLHSQKLEAIGRLAGGVAHDFNNILAVISGYSDLTLATLDERDPVMENIQEIKRGADRAGSLTRQLLAFSRKQQIEPKTLNLNSIVTNVDKMLRRIIGEHIELQTELAPGLENIKADPGQIEQVLMNIAVNARDAMPKGGKLMLKTSNVSLDEQQASELLSLDPGHYVRLDLGDTGSGMDEQTQSQIFEPFFTTKEVGKGTGLGLSTVHGIVRQAGGDILVESTLGKGTTFTIYFPTESEEDVDVESEAVGGLLRTGSETVLLVEDEEPLRRLVEKILDGLGYTVIEAESAEAAMELVESEKPDIDLLLTDVVMPGQNGLQLAKDLGAKMKDLKCIFMSGYVDGSVVELDDIETSTVFLKKPFTPNELAARLRFVLDS